MSGDPPPLHQTRTHAKLPPLMPPTEHTATELPAIVLGAFPAMVRDVSLRGDICLPPISVQQKDVLSSLAEKYGSACCVVTDGEGRFHLRNGPSNPYLREKLAEELRYLHDEGEKAPADAPLVLQWAFTDRTVHREVVTLLQTLGYNIGIFLGERLFDGAYFYRVEVGLRYFPHWEAERRKLIDPSLKGDADPFPIPLAAQQSPRLLGVYRNFVRPFLYERNCATTRCGVGLYQAVGGKIPREARSVGSLFSLRHEIDSSGKIFFRRWTRYLLHVFSKYLGELRRQDSKGVEKTLSRYGEDLNPVDAENMTPHFGHFNCCLELQYYHKDLAELEKFSCRSGCFVHVSVEGGLAMVLATMRRRPALARGYTLVFPTEDGQQRRPVGRDSPSHGKVGPADAATQPSLLLEKKKDNNYCHVDNDKKVSRMELLKSTVHSTSESSSRGSSGSRSRSSRSDNTNGARGRDLGVKESRWGKDDGRAALEDGIKLSTLGTTSPAPNSLMGTERGAQWRFSLAASNLYDTIVGKMQRNLPPGWSVCHDPAGNKYILDHLRGKAYHSNSPMVPKCFAVGQQELFHVLNSVI